MVTVPNVPQAQVSCLNQCRKERAAALAKCGTLSPAEIKADAANNYARTNAIVACKQMAETKYKECVVLRCKMTIK